MSKLLFLLYFSNSKNMKFVITSARKWQYFCKKPAEPLENENIGRLRFYHFAGTMASSVGPHMRVQSASLLSYWSRISIFKNLYFSR
ncbi:hypothetical protein [Thalassospira sp. TSL5-1]|uniref:hypothetical protein n=1 Tax=Thalassospira sp. TSL5-1 TaxID=1544451 RepID=UPI000939F5B2|nr:hypothetical protein [Thalassospira sp. TSL5-1]OKH86861.1 hypothetical protein LF95_20935 [Thalassospira sp. TSL5-1]